MQVITLPLKIICYLIFAFLSANSFADCNTDVKYFFMNGVDKVDETQIAVDMRILNETLLQKNF